MLNISQQIKKVFQLYQAGDFQQAQKLNNTILEEEPTHIYAQRYKTMLDLKVKTWKKSAKIKWKTLKCPHCVAKIPFSWLSISQQNQIKLWEYNNLEIKCPYCHIEFVLQKRKVRSILWIKIWNIATIDWKKYRATWYVEYKWTWYEWSYHWRTQYLEWLLFCKEENSYYYFSEGKSYDEGEVEFEYELSHKVIPSFSVPHNFSEKVKVKVISVYWENSKKFTIWEGVELWIFSSWWKNYVIEKEWVWSQKEAGIYQTKTITKYQASAMFGKKVSIWYNSNKTTTFTKTIAILIFSVVAVFFIFKPIFNVALESKTQTEILEINKAKKVELHFKNSTAMPERKTSTTRYDYGGVRTYYEQNKWLQFSVKTQEDKKILEKIEELKNSWDSGNIDEEKIKKMFDWDLYKLK